MSLRRRITGAVALGVAAVVLTLAVVVYFSVRSNLIDEVDRSLDDRAQAFLRPDGPGPADPGGQANGRRPPFQERREQPDGPPPGAPGTPGAGLAPPPQRFGAALGYFQFVDAKGKATAIGNAKAQLPVDQRVREVASSGKGRYFSDVTVNGTHLRVLTVAGPAGQAAVQIALPLTDTDQVLDRLLLTFGAVIAGGIALAALMGAVIGRAALAPIERFIGRTEKVTGVLDGSERLDQGGPEELARLAASFNRTLDALEQSVEAQRHLVADASHELRTPIAALRSNVQIFLESERLPISERRALQHSVIEELDELTQLVADVVELARSADANQPIEQLDLDEIVSDAVERTRRRAPAIDFDVQLEPTTINHAHDRVARAVMNVLDNARKWSPPDGRIEVSLAGGTLSVRDHGPGFDQADLPKVFDRFYRAERARRMPGSGLGLAIVRQAAEAQGGFAEAANAPDGGAIVRANFGDPVEPARP